MPPAAFDPCKQWLGIDAVDLVDPWRVLGLPPTERRPEAIHQAAQARLATLGRVAPGPFDRARDALVARVEEARGQALAHLAAQAPAALSMPPAPGGFAARQAGNAAPAPPLVPRVPTVPRPPAAPAPSAWPEDPDPVHHPDGSDGSTPAIKIRPQTVYRRRSSGSGVLLVLIAALAAAAGGLYWYKFKRVPARGPATPAPRDVAQIDPSPPNPSPPPRPTPPPAPMRRPRKPPAPEPETNDSDKPVPMIKPAPPTPPPAPPPEPPAPARPDPPAEDKARLAQSLGDACTALRASDFAAAEAASRAAAAVAMTPESQTRVDRWGDLVTFAKGFAGYREKALAAVKSGDEYDIDGKKVGVVEIDADTFTYRYAGKNRTTPRDKIPGGIVMAIVEGWFDENPANDLFIGAYHATKAEPDFEKAAAAWQRAQSRGADASMLLPLLDDPILTTEAP